MATSGKKVTYREPAGYFNADMRKAAQDWDKEHAGKKATKTTKEKTPAAGKAAGKTTSKKK